MDLRSEREFTACTWYRFARCIGGLLVLMISAQAGCFGFKPVIPATASFACMEYQLGDVSTCIHSFGSASTNVTASCSGCILVCLITRTSSCNSLFFSTNIILSTSFPSCFSFSRSYPDSTTVSTIGTGAQFKNPIFYSDSNMPLTNLSINDFPCNISTDQVLAAPISTFEMIVFHFDID